MFPTSKALTRRIANIDIEDSESGVHAVLHNIDNEEMNHIMAMKN